MNSRKLIAWSELHERRARAGWWTSRPVIAVVAGGAIAGWVAWRANASTTAASHAWLAASCVAFAVAFLRVPFQLYWRTDAALLAQLPIDGGALFDAALVRCVRAAATTTIAVLVGALPLATDLELYARHAAIAGALGIAAAALLPAVATYAATLVAFGQANDRVKKLTGVAEAPPSSALLGALPGLASTGVLVGVILLHRWLVGEVPPVRAPIVLAAIAGTSVLALVAIRAQAPAAMGSILRDVSALDRQRLATLEIRPPTAIERGISSLIGDAALAYGKDARLVRRRYPMAFALGALAFIVLAIVGIAQPDDPGPWLTATIAGAAAYGVVLAGRLQRTPIELPRLSDALPIGAASRARAKLAWLAGWWTIFVAVPGVFAVARQPEPLSSAALLAAATIVVIVAGRLTSVRRS